ncbi:hypothetical protein GCM10007301_54250 [Azorhizobium oxalatiphilum]|uniref:DUF6460 domain-containing protein n=1 Tax=Azorhizobium oxalatiphilum TaxID=980631 RepID=A0A917CG72_9HYPH|nr:DUF6460 domain-containing protein [Azorhizobium oxalatiphilum]GGF87534.1 hypothetical protein GCM10007301_54250 [Azorhizobium oxalatiphilum]
MADGNSQLSRFLGGSPVSVLLRLVILCLVVGVILAALGLDPANLLASLRRMVESLFSLGFDTVERLWRYFLLGALIVIPLWLLSRIFRMGK